MRAPLRKQTPIARNRVQRPDYPNGMNCKKCDRVFYWYHYLREHYKRHSEEEALAKALNEHGIEHTTSNQQQQTTSSAEQQQTTSNAEQDQVLIHAALDFEMNNAAAGATTTEKHNNNSINNNNSNNNNNLIFTTLQEQHEQQQNQHEQQHLQQEDPTASKGYVNTANNSTFHIPSDAIPQIVETDNIIDNDIDFDFNDDALFGDFDNDVNSADDGNNDVEDFQDLLMTSDDDFEELISDRSESEAAQQRLNCTHCNKSFFSQYQFENHMFVDRGMSAHGHASNYKSYKCSCILSILFLCIAKSQALQ